MKTCELKMKLKITEQGIKLNGKFGTTSVMIADMTIGQALTHINSALERGAHCLVEEVACDASAN